MSLHIVRRGCAAPLPDLGPAMHPVLSRVYAARGVRSVHDLDTSLERLLPVGTLEGIPAAVELLLAHRAGTRAGHRRLRRRWRHQQRAGGARAARLRLRVGGLPGAEPLSLRLRAHPRDRGAARPSARRHCWSRWTTASPATPGWRPRARAASTCSSPITICRARSCRDANVIVNPNLAGSRFASRALAGVGVAFYVMAARAARSIGRLDGAPGGRGSCSTSWRSAPSPTWCRSMPTTACWWRRA